MSAEKGRGRPPVGPQLKVRFRPDQIALIDRLVGDGVAANRSAAIRLLIDEAGSARNELGQTEGQPDG